MIEEAANDVLWPEGQLVKMAGVSVMGKNEEGKVFKNNDYAKAVEKFEYFLL